MSVVGYIPQSPDNEAICELRDEIKNLNKSNTEFSKKSLRLAQAMKWLTIFMAIGLVVQILLAMMSIPYRHNCEQSGDIIPGQKAELCFTWFDFGMFGFYRSEDKAWRPIN